MFGRAFNLPSADLTTSATVVLDRDVIGFRPVGRQPLPLVPLALLTDPEGVRPQAWEAQVVVPGHQDGEGGVDTAAYDRVRRRFLRVPDEVPVGDGICEMTVTIPLAGQPVAAEDADQSNACLVQLGADNWSAYCRQVSTGVTAEDLAGPDFHGQLVLGADNQLRVFGALHAPAYDTPELGQLLQALKVLQMTGEPRIWPLFGAYEPDPAGGDGVAALWGFVAARVVWVELATAKDEQGQERQQLRLTLQPCMMISSAAVTDNQRRLTHPLLYNLYICKLRLLP